MITSKNVAEFFLLKNEPEMGDILTNLKIQKLVYYAQGFHLAIYEEPLFIEPIVAWEHGPVVESLYHDYKIYGSGAITVEQIETDVSIFNKDQFELLEEIFEIYGQFSGWKLRNMTHSEKPWIETKRNQEISTALMKDFFKEQLV